MQDILYMKSSNENLTGRLKFWQARITIFVTLMRISISTDRKIYITRVIPYS